jgi:hypothetical protein
MQALQRALSPVSLSSCAGPEPAQHQLPVPLGALAALEPRPEEVAEPNTRAIVKRASNVWRVPPHHAQALLRGFAAACLGNKSYVLIDADTQYIQPLVFAQIIMAPSGGGKSRALQGAMGALELGQRRHQAS